MTQDEALKEARIRWGKKAAAWRSGISAEFYVCSELGYRGRRVADSVTGKGDSWEAAFADADRKVASNA